MKTYNNPTIEVVDLKIDEIILASGIEYKDLMNTTKFDWEI